MAAFKVPRTLPQDLLLISEFVDVQEQHHSPKPLAQDNDDNVESSGSEIESEEEIEKDLTALQDDGDEDAKPSYVVLPSVPLARLTHFFGNLLKNFGFELKFCIKLFRLGLRLRLSNGKQNGSSQAQAACARR
jgi:hypothetical protein